jgi:hypothetical protein
MRRRKYGASCCPSVAILDVRIGQQTIAPVAQQRRRRGIPFIFYTGQSENNPICAEWLHCKIAEKPAHPHTLGTAIAKLVMHPI